MSFDRISDSATDSYDLTRCEVKLYGKRIGNSVRKACQWVWNIYDGKFPRCFAKLQKYEHSLLIAVVRTIAILPPIQSIG